MTRILVAIRAFFAVLFRAKTAERIRAALRDPVETPCESAARRPVATPKPEPARPSRSEAVTLLATLQREARMLDFFGEPIGEFSDAQIGAAVRDVHRQCGEVLGRLFALAPVVDRAEGDAIEVPAGFDAGRYRLVGNVSGDPPHRGLLTHHGWVATKCELPEWSGEKAAALIVAPAEIELR